MCESSPTLACQKTILFPPIQLVCLGEEFSSFGAAPNTGIYFCRQAIYVLNVIGFPLLFIWMDEETLYNDLPLGMADCCVLKDWCSFAPFFFCLEWTCVLFVFCSPLLTHSPSLLTLTEQPLKYLYSKCESLECNDYPRSRSGRSGRCQWSNLWRLANRKSFRIISIASLSCLSLFGLLYFLINPSTREQCWILF